MIEELINSDITTISLLVAVVVYFYRKTEKQAEKIDKLQSEVKDLLIIKGKIDLIEHFNHQIQKITDINHDLIEIKGMLEKTK